MILRGKKELKDSDIIWLEVPRKNGNGKSSECRMVICEVKKGSYFEDFRVNDSQVIEVIKTKVFNKSYSRNEEFKHTIRYQNSAEGLVNKDFEQTFKELSNK